MLRVAASIFCATALAAEASPTCPPAGFENETVKDFNLDSFIAHRWHIQQQMEVPYLPKSQNRCVYAEYAKRSGGIWGYEVGVHNHAEEVEAPYVVHDSGTKICAKIVDQSRGKFVVGPCFLPSVLAGDYWVIDFSDAEGYALVSGGPPTNSAPGGCRTGSGVNGSGLWIFTRQQARDQALVDKVRGIAAGKGFDLTVLNDIDQVCNDEATLLV